MYTKVKAYIKQNQMIDIGDVVIAGVSGGPDSMAMLHVLKELSGELDFTLRTVHVHHGIRGTEADRDLELVRNICAQWKIPCQVYRYDVPLLAKVWKTGEEETGRLVRKEAFSREISFIEEEYKIKKEKIKTAIAHNQNDLAETMLHHLARGSGLRGLCSMRPVSGERIRPVLCLNRKEIEWIVKEQRIPYVTDSSNLEDVYTRNRIRHHVLPMLEQEINAQAVAHMAEAAGLLAQAEDYLSAKGRTAAEKCLQEDGSYFLTQDFIKEEDVIRNYVLREIFFAVTEKRKDFTQFHLRQVLGLFTGQVGKMIQLPYELLAIREYTGVRIRKGNILQEKKKIQTEGELCQEKWEVPEEGEMDCPVGRFRSRVFFREEQKICEKKYTKWLDYDKIQGRLYVRTRKNGDYMIINQAGNKKKIQRCMIDEKIPAQERERIPLLSCGAEILWMVGGRISEKYKITSETRKILEIRYMESEEDK